MIRVMGVVDGSTNEWVGWITAEDLEAVALSLGVKPRRLAGWRERRLIPHPTRTGFDGKRPIWAYPPGTDTRLESAARWRDRTDDFQAILFGVWLDRNPVPVEDIRNSILHCLDRVEHAMLSELKRAAGKDSAAEEIVTDPDQLSQALDRFAEDLAGRRSTFPLKRQVEMSLAERTRGMRYWLATLFGLDADSDDAIHLERILGVSRGRSGTAQGIVTWPPEETLPKDTPLTIRSLRDAVQNADPDVILAAGTAVHTYLHALRFLFPALIPPRSPLRQFTTEANNLFDNAQPQALALFAAVLISGMRQQDAAPEQIREHTKNLSLKNFVEDVLPRLTPEELQEFTNERQRHSTKN